MGVVAAWVVDRSGSECRPVRRAAFRVLRTACVACSRFALAISSSMLRISIALLWRLVNSSRCSVCRCCSRVSLSSSSVVGVVGGYSRCLFVSESESGYEPADDVSHLSVSGADVGDSASSGGVVGGVVVGDTRSTVVCLMLAGSCVV
jgi:hypothetical protein